MPESKPLSSRTYTLATEARKVAVAAMVCTAVVYVGALVAIALMSLDGPSAAALLVALTGPWAGVVYACLNSVTKAAEAHGRRHWDKGLPSGVGDV